MHRQFLVNCGYDCGHGYDHEYGYTDYCYDTDYYYDRLLILLDYYCGY